MCQLIRGHDVIDDPDRLVAIAASQLKIDPMHFDDVLRVLGEADLVEQRKGKIYEKVRQIDFGENYERVGSLWQSRDKDHREELTIHSLDELVEFPQLASELAILSGTSDAVRNQVLEVASNARLIETLNVGTGEPMLFAPILWDLDPKRVSSAVGQLGSASGLKQIMAKIQCAASGAELPLLQLSSIEEGLASKAITIGLLPTFPVNSVSGEKSLPSHRVAMESAGKQRRSLDQQFEFIAWHSISITRNLGKCCARRVSVPRKSDKPIMPSLPNVATYTIWPLSICANIGTTPFTGKYT